MALERLRRPENTPGDFYVDSTCIDCDLCRQIAPETFTAVGDQSAVHRQPATPEAEWAALKALVTCPTASIGTLAKKSGAKAAAEAYPEPVDGNVCFCGHASEASYGAASYLILRPAGNVMIDSPRFSRPLARRIRLLGGVRRIFLTHRDDVADHELWAREFGAARVMHRADMSRAHAGIEWVVSGTAPVDLDHDLVALPTPGHTPGHMVLLHRDRHLFSGDHLWWSDALGSLSASRAVCWYSWEEQIRSMERLREYSFESVLPGHGRRAFGSRESMRAHLSTCIERMKRLA
jgi:glyoxylase-like metal-dependent hydrolase (beta-lactamase superfamily II)/ferredoxin